MAQRALARRAITMAAPARRSAARSLSAWSNVQSAPADPILGLTQDFLADTDAKKVSLGVGAYRDENGKPYVLPSIAEAEKRVVASLTDHEYAPITGDAKFLASSLEFAYGAGSAPLAEKRVAATQALSGTGCLRVAAQLLERLPSLTGGDASAKQAIYVPDPTWSNHLNIFRDAGLEIRTYRYLDAATRTKLDFDAMLEDLSAAESGATILLHACAHNPTGVDPSMDQWKALSAALKATGAQLFFDCAYQGFASGDAERAAGGLRHFVAEGHTLMLAQSYAKNFGLYGERLKAVIRPMYSSPPVHGARVVAEVLGDAQLRAKWTAECKAMADRISEMRAALKAKLADAGSTRDWAHITDQIGMFAYTGLTADQVQAMRDEFHVYCTLDGRISVAGLTPSNVDHVAKAIHAVSK
ncbi:aspartate aminotransferase [Aureococcus anophagefferens]|nr:aspartate aminotransferase [Aureococcus anophagefferens]